MAIDSKAEVKSNGGLRGLKLYMRRDQVFETVAAAVAYKSVISSVNTSAVQHVQAVKQAPVDADGDNDGSAAASAPAPQVSRPTATLGNHLDVHA